MDKLFVYGTLGPGGPNEDVMKKIGGKWIKAIVKGCLYSEGWGAEMGYPGLLLEEEGDDIEGHIFISERLEKYWSFLDDFEGDGYERIEVLAYCENGERIATYVYALKR
ncbi:gamma-glutamylcyclotransferase family protein [Terasakiella sp. SH-1]|uniref:gamma-glutamylcyclotransferase family protein n=1 Tax=Terasakiella sp. SH-1 TaxID=2560057 RepID=UPI001073C32A|nr:gamma-glutamylcyclotransferase family protein [Terasakiella sp. SH-1]